MNIKKILKFYLVLTLMLTAFASLSYNDEFRYYLSTYATSVLDYKYNETKPFVSVYSPSASLKSYEKSYVYYKDNPGNIVFNITNSPDKSMVATGTKNAEIMSFNFKTANVPIELENLALKIVGINGDDIDAAYLAIGNEVIAEAYISGDYLKFTNISYGIAANSSSSIKIKLDLSENLKINNRIRLDIESPQDSAIRVNNSLYGINGYYPMKGKYLSISKPR